MTDTAQTAPGPAPTGFAAVVQEAVAAQWDAAQWKAYNATAPWARHLENSPFQDLCFKKQALHAYLDDAARNHPSRKAVIFQNYTLTYAQLKDKAEAFAAALHEHGVREGERVAVMLPNIPQTVIAIWGVLKAGCVAVMTNPLYMEKELTHHFHDAQAKILITLDLLWKKLAPLHDRLGLEMTVVTRIADGLAFPLNFLQPWKARREGMNPQVPYDDTRIVPWKRFMSTRNRVNATVDDPEHTLALLQYTGGTTGLSKAAMLTHQNLAAQMQILRSIVQETAEKRYTYLSIMPFFHVFGLVGNVLFPSLYAAAPIPVPRYTPGDLLCTIDKYRSNFFIGTPSVYISLMQQKDIAKYDLTCIEMCISGSAPFPVEAMKRFQEMTHTHITEGFGLTEASPCITANPIYGLQKAGSIGVALPATEVRIVDLETGTKTLGDNEIGELVARGPQVMLGYWNRPEETANALRDGWLYTGDIAYRDEDGYYFIVDRKKDMAIVGGYNVYPREIDEVLYEHPKVAEAVAVSVPHRSRGETLKAYVVPKAGESLTVAELVSHCREKLANYKVPKFFELREELPKSLVGKVLRRVLREEEEQKLRETLRTKTAELIDKASQRAGEFRERAGAMMDQAREKAGEIMEQASQSAEDFKGRASNMMDQAREKARGHAEQLSRNLSAGVDRVLGKDKTPPPDTPARETREGAAGDTSGGGTPDGPHTPDH